MLSDFFFFFIYFSLFFFTSGFFLLLVVFNSTKKFFLSSWGEFIFSRLKYFDTFSSSVHICVPYFVTFTTQRRATNPKKGESLHKCFLFCLILFFFRSHTTHTHTETNLGFSLRLRLFTLFFQNNLRYFPLGSVVQTLVHTYCTRTHMR